MTEGLSAAVASMPVRKPCEEHDAQEPSMFALLAAGTYNRGARQPAPASQGKVPAIPDLSRRRFLTISAAATLAGAAAVATSACASHTRGGTEMPSRILRGVTVDSLDDIEETAAVLSSSANRLTVRLVMDSERPLEDCVRAVAALKPHADIMIQVIDSTDLPDRSASWIAKRTQDAMDAFGDDIALWEIGNELNGSWAGSSPSQINAKARASYDVVRAASTIGPPTTATIRPGRRPSPMHGRRRQAFPTWTASSSRSTKRRARPPSTRAPKSWPLR